MLGDKIIDAVMFYRREPLALPVTIIVGLYFGLLLTMVIAS